MKAREFLTADQKEFIRANSKKKFISEMAGELGAASSTIYCFIKKNNLDFKRVDNKKKADSYFKQGCFNPHERENWLV